jgi:hypothetical protein
MASSLLINGKMHRIRHRRCSSDENRNPDRKEQDRAPPIRDREAGKADEDGARTRKRWLSREVPVLNTAAPGHASRAISAGGSGVSPRQALRCGSRACRSAGDWRPRDLAGVPVVLGKDRRSSSGGIAREAASGLASCVRSWRKDVRYANINIIEGHDANQYGIGIVSARIAEMVLNDERAVVPHVLWVLKPRACSDRDSTCDRSRKDAW